MAILQWLAAADPVEDLHEFTVKNIFPIPINMPTVFPLSNHTITPENVASFIKAGRARFKNRKRKQQYIENKRLSFRT